jgi:hypothetical protein
LFVRNLFEEKHAEVLDYARSHPGEQKSFIELSPSEFFVLKLLDSLVQNDVAALTFVIMEKHLITGAQRFKLLQLMNSVDN